MKLLSRAISAVALAGVLVLAGCTKASPEPPEQAVPDLSTEGPAQSQLQGKLLADTDLPEGYEETTLPTVQGGFGSLIGCPALEPPPAAEAAEARVSFARLPAGNLISESVRIAGPDVSHQLLADLAKLPQKCSAAAPAQALPLGKENTTLELNATLAGTGTVVNGYITGVRDDQIVVVVVYVSPGKADRATFDKVTQTAWGKALSS